jgi:hypothetical protein
VSDHPKSSSFTKLHASILDSSIWGESHATRIVWITMLAMADADGVVHASVGGLARRAVVSREECEAALATFLAPDPDTRDGSTGERIATVPGGWHLLNYKQYRERRTESQIATAERVAKHRRNKAEALPPVTDALPPVTEHLVTVEAEAEAEEELKEEQPSTASRSRGASRPDVLSVFEVWRERFAKPASTKLSAKRKRRIAWAIDRYGLDECKRCLEGYAASDFHRENGHTDVELFFRDESKFEAGLERAAKAGASAKALSGMGRVNYEAWSAEMLRLQDQSHELHRQRKTEEAARVDERRRAIESAGPERWAESRRAANGRGNATVHELDRAGAQRAAVAELFGGGRDAAR